MDMTKRIRDLGWTHEQAATFLGLTLSGLRKQLYGQRRGHQTDRLLTALEIMSSEQRERFRALVAERREA